MSEIRWVTIPATIAVESYDQNGAPRSVPTPFAPSYLKSRVDDEAGFGATLELVKMSGLVAEAFKGAQPGDVIGLPLEQWEALCRSVRTPAHGYSVPVMRQLLPYATAILDAPSTKPEAPPVAAAPELAQAAE